jgi:hypothetical protein
VPLPARHASRLQRACSVGLEHWDRRKLLYRCSWVEMQRLIYRYAELNAFSAVLLFWTSNGLRLGGASSGREKRGGGGLFSVCSDHVLMISCPTGVKRVVRWHKLTGCRFWRSKLIAVWTEYHLSTRGAMRCASYTAGGDAGWTRTSSRYQDPR